MATVDDAPVGMVNLILIDRMPRPGRTSGRWGYLGNLFVAPEHRGVGLGARLVSTVLGAAADLGLERVVVHPSDESIAFWRRSGFDRADELLVHRRSGPT